MNKKGLTLVELVVAMAIAGVLLAVLTQGLLAMAREHTRVLARNELESNLGFAMDEIAADCAQAVWIQTAADGQLALRNEFGAEIRYTLKQDAMAKRHLYDLQGQVLYRSTDGGKNQPIANFIGQMLIAPQEEGDLVTAVIVTLKGQAGEEEITVEKTLPIGGVLWRR